jgi:hypothetical protein
MAATVRIGNCCGCGSGFGPRTPCVDDDTGQVYNIPRFIRWTVVSNYAALNGQTGVTELPPTTAGCHCVAPITVFYLMSRAVLFPPSAFIYYPACVPVIIRVCLPCPLSSNFPNAQGEDPDPPTAPNLDYFRVTASSEPSGLACLNTPPITWPPHDTDFPGGSETASGVCCNLYMGHWKINGFGAGFTAHSPVYTVTPNHFTDFGNDIWEYIPCSECLPVEPALFVCDPVPEFDPADPSYAGDVQFQILLEAA